MSTLSDLWKDERVKLTVKVAGATLLMDKGTVLVARAVTPISPLLGYAVVGASAFYGRKLLDKIQRDAEDKAGVSPYDFLSYSVGAQAATSIALLAVRYLPGKKPSGPNPR